MRNVLLNTLVLFTILILFNVAAAQPAAPPAAPRLINIELTAEQWRADLRHFATEIPRRHKNAFHTISRSQFEAAVTQLDHRMGTLRNDEILVEFLRLIAMIGDGHTSVEEHSLFSFGMYPVRYHLYSDGLYIRSAPEEQKEIVGAKVLKIGNLTVEEALHRIKGIAWGDSRNEQAFKVESVFLLMIPKVLQGLNITTSSESIVLHIEKAGVKTPVTITAVRSPREFMAKAKFISANRDAERPIPLYLKNDGDNFWFDNLKDRKILYVQMNAVQNKPDETVEAFFRKVFRLIESEPVEKLVLDLRNNTGGNNGLNTPIVTGLIRSRLNERGKLFVITGRRTFSAAQNLVNEIEKYTNAIFVGEPTGSSPNMYGDAVTVSLPSSNLAFRVSSLWHQIDPRDRRIYTTPEIYAEATASDFENNIDPAFNAIISYVPGNTYKDIVAEASTGYIAAFIKRYRAFKSDPSNRFVNTEAGTNALGYRLMQAKRFADAIEVLKLNVEDYPRSANAYDSLGEAYSISGDKAAAIMTYEKAVRIDPGFTSSIEALKRLKAM